MEYTDRFVEANGVRLHVVDWGGDGPPAIFLNPTGFHAHVWDTYVRHLAGRFHCLAYDTRGHGDSDKPGVYGWTDFADDLEALMDALGLRGALGVGHSAGGTSITIVAARRPELCSRAVLLDPILFLDGPRPAVEGTGNGGLGGGAAKRRMVWPDRQAVFDRYASRPPFASWQPELLHLYVDYGVFDRPDGQVELKCSGEDEAKMYAWGPYPLNSAEYLPRIACPVLLVAGEQSNAFPPARARRAAELIPTCTLVTLPGTHFVPYEHPDQVQAAIDVFLDETGV